MQSSPSNDRPTPAPAAADEWPRHEHVAPPAQIAAQKLVETTGSAELAKQAVDEAAEPAADAAGGSDEFAKREGFASYMEMFEAAEPIADSGAVWLVAANGPAFVAWSERDLTGFHFKSREDAIAAIRRGNLGAGSRPAE